MEMPGLTVEFDSLVPLDVSLKFTGRPAFIDRDRGRWILSGLIDFGKCW